MPFPILQSVLCRVFACIYLFLLASVFSNAQGISPPFHLRGNPANARTGTAVGQLCLSFGAQASAATCSRILISDCQSVNAIALSENTVSETTILLVAVNSTALLQGESPSSLCLSGQGTGSDLNLLLACPCNTSQTSQSWSKASPSVGVARYTNAANSRLIYTTSVSQSTVRLGTSSTGNTANLDVVPVFADGVTIWQGPNFTGSFTRLFYGNYTNLQNSSGIFGSIQVPSGYYLTTAQQTYKSTSGSIENAGINAYLYVGLMDGLIIYDETSFRGMQTFYPPNSLLTTLSSLSPTNIMSLRLINTGDLLITSSAYDNALYHASYAGVTGSNRLLLPGSAPATVFQLQNTTCGSKCIGGACDLQSNCTCSNGWTGARCDQCANGLYGRQCASTCQCSTNGICSQGANGSGHCSCQKGFTGSTCSDCLKDFYGSTCAACSCGHGLCSDGQGGTGSCSCLDGYSGSSCSTCSDGFYLVDGECLACPTGCKQCTSSTACTLCYSPNTLSGGQCTINTFEGCDSACSECWGSANGQCSKCASGSLIGSTCWSTCPLGYYNNGGSCSKCSSNCATCSSAAVCDSCISQTYLQLDNTCKAECPAGNFYNSTSGKCSSCDQNCLTCSQSATSCLTCPSGSALYQESCYDSSSVPAGAYWSNGAIYACDTSCATCSGAGTCTSCPQMQPILFEGKCLDTCPDGFYASSNSGSVTCLASKSGCSVGDNLNCAQCQGGGVVESGNCLMSCPDGTYLDTQSLNCMKCSTKCSRCKYSPNQCDICVVPLSLARNGSCILPPVSLTVSKPEPTSETVTNNSNNLGFGNIPQWAAGLSLASIVLAALGVPVSLWFLWRRKLHSHHRVGLAISDTLDKLKIKAIPGTTTHMPLLKETAHLDVETTDVSQMNANKELPGLSTTKAMGPAQLIALTQLQQTITLIDIKSASDIALPKYLKLDYHKHIVLQSKVGSGGSGDVSVGLMTTDDHKQRTVAVKMIRLRDDLTKDENELVFQQEVAALSALSYHDNIAHIRGYTTDPCCIISDLYSEDLFHHIHTRNGLADDVVLEVLYDIVHGLAACHAFGIIHRDIKTSNMFLERVDDPSKAHPFRVRVGDFGICRVVGLRRLQENAQMSRKFLNIFGVSIRYGAPEVLRRLTTFKAVCEKANRPELYDTQASSVEQDKASDVYSFAIVMNEILFGQVPFGTTSNEDVLHNVCIDHGRPVVPKGTDGPLRSALIKIMRLSWDSKWDSRPTFDDIDGTIGLLLQA